MTQPRSTQAVVITSINPPTAAVRAFAAIPGWTEYVVGDRKTPVDWACSGVHYVPSDAESRLPWSQLAKVLPHDHYTRKMLGYLCAIEAGAAIIVDTDDDNVPHDGWSVPAFDGRWDTTPPELGYVNTYRYFTEQRIWPRGLPLHRVLALDSELDSDACQPQDARVGVWQGLADGDPDVDAIYRLTVGESCVFDSRAPLVLAPGTWSPFNSQNTAFRFEAFALMYLPSTVTFRFTDILRGVVAQPILWAAGLRLGFTEATVFQDRNEHDLMRDFESEVPCYLDVERAGAVVVDAIDGASSIEDNLVRAYAALARAGVVTDAECAFVEAWVSDITTLQPR